MQFFWAVTFFSRPMALLAAKILSVIVGVSVRKGMSMGRVKSSELLRDFVDNTLRKVVMILGIVIALSMLEINISPILAGLGVVGFVLGFAFQNSLSNLAAGFMIPGMIQQAMQSGAQPKMRCPNCTKDIPFGSKFCPECGTNLAATVDCPQCQATLPVGSKFCPNCGQQLGAPVAQAPSPSPASPAEGGEDAPGGGAAG